MRLFESFPASGRFDQLLAEFMVLAFGLAGDLGERALHGLEFLAEGHLFFVGLEPVAG